MPDLLDLQAEEIQAKNLAEDKAVAVSGAYAQNFWVQLAELWGRSSIMYWRNPSYNLVRRRRPPPLLPSFCLHLRTVTGQ